MASTLAAKLESTMDGREAIVIVESEFNKNGIDAPAYASTFDKAMEEVVATFHAVPGVKIAVGFGNWDPKTGSFSRAPWPPRTSSASKPCAPPRVTPRNVTLAP